MGGNEHYFFFGPRKFEKSHPLEGGGGRTGGGEPSPMKVELTCFYTFFSPGGGGGGAGSGTATGPRHFFLRHRLGLFFKKRGLDLTLTLTLTLTLNFPIGSTRT